MRLDAAASKSNSIPLARPRLARIFLSPNKNRDFLVCNKIITTGRGMNFNADSNEFRGVVVTLRNSDVHIFRFSALFLIERRKIRFHPAFFTMSTSYLRDKFEFRAKVRPRTVEGDTDLF